MTYSLTRAIVFLILALLTIALAYLYQRRERTQKLRGVWVWPAIFTVLAVHAAVQQLPRDPQLWPWLVIAFAIGLPIGVARAFAFKIRAGEAPGTFRIMATPLSGTIYLAVLILNEFEHVFRHGDPSAGRISCAFLALTAGNSIAVNVMRVMRYRLGAARTANLHT